MQGCSRPGLPVLIPPLCPARCAVPAEVPEAQRAKRAAEDRNRRAVALCVCRLLLGDSEGAEEALGISPGGTEAVKCDRVVLQFIKVRAAGVESRRGFADWGI